MHFSHLQSLDGLPRIIHNCGPVVGEKKTASTWPPLQVALRSETDVFTLLPATSTSETARVLIRTDGLIRRK